MKNNIENIYSSQADVIARLFWFRDMSDFYRRARDFGHCNEYEVKAFEEDKAQFLKSNNLDSVYW